MFKIVSPKFFKWFKKPYINASSVFIFIIFRNAEIAKNERLNNHEIIHFFQQLELLFLPQWLLYIFFYVKGRLSGLNHYQSYRANPFEKEAYENEADLKYLIHRKPYTWTKYL